MLTQIQRRVLSNYRKFRAQGGPNWYDLLGWRSVCYLAGAALIGAGAYLCAFPWWAGFFLGFAAGALWVNIMRARHAMLAWPTIADVVDWQRVEGLLNHDRQPPAA